MLPRRLSTTLIVVGLVSFVAVPARGQIVFQPATGTVTWNATTSWNPATIPTNTGDNATFNGAATALNPAQTGNRTASLDGAKTIGSIVFNTDLSTFTNTVATGTGGPLTFDEAGAGPATMTTMGGGTGNNTISVAMVFTDNVVANVNNTAASSAAGSLNLTGTISGPGGFTKNGDGLATFGTGAKTYTGPTVLNGGRLRMSNAAAATGTSSFTINAGGQLDFIAGGSFTLGPGNLNLNGAGPTTGPFAIFPGAIRPDRGLTITVTNPTVLQTDTVLQMEANNGTGGTGSPVGQMTFSGPISGPGRLQFTPSGTNDIEQGILILSGTNTYTGGTFVAGGILRVSGANATLGTGNVTVDQGGDSAIARLDLQSGVLDAIANTAVLSLAGGGTPGVADQNFAILGAGVNEIVGGLILGGVSQSPGTYGATGSGATNISDEFFSGAGIITVAGVPEPGTLALAGLAAAGFAVRRLRRKPTAA